MTRIVVLQGDVIPKGGLCFFSSLWPSAIVSFGCTRHPQAGFSSLWSRGTTGGPSTVSSSRPDGGMAEWTRKGFKCKRQKKRGEASWMRGTDRQAEWQTLINTSLWLHFTGVQTWIPVIAFHQQTLWKTFAATILWMKSRKEQKSLLVFPSVSVFLRHNNCCCYPLSLFFKKRKKK